jgi:hypothetical protein
MNISKSQTNFVLGETLKKINSFEPIKREEIIKKFSPDVIMKSWELVCKFVIKNYQQGKGTVIPKFGIFGFDHAELNLEGTTNQNQRDSKPRRPIFIVAKEFVEKLKPGIFGKNGIVYYQIKKGNNSPQVKMNYAEIAYSLGINKDECFTIIENILGIIADNIIAGTFKNKEMPGIGILMVKNNIMCVKFNEDFIESVKLIPQKLIQTKKMVSLCMETNEKNNEENPQTSRDKPNLIKSLNKLRPKT